jgi:hypothetical protein
VTDTVSICFCDIRNVLPVIFNKNSLNLLVLDGETLGGVVRKVQHFNTSKQRGRYVPLYPTSYVGFIYQLLKTFGFKRSIFFLGNTSNETTIATIPYPESMTSNFRERCPPRLEIVIGELTNVAPEHLT